MFSYIFLQQALGQREDLQADYRPPATFSDEYWFGYEVKANEELLPAAQLLLQSLCRFLRNTQLQTGEITWQLAGIDHRVEKVRVRSTASHSDWKNWYQLTRIRFEQLQLANSVEGLALTCGQLQSGQLENIDLFTPGSQREPLAALLDRLRNRLGLQAIEQVGRRDAHLPEYALHVGTDSSELISPIVSEYLRHRLRLRPSGEQDVEISVVVTVAPRHSAVVRARQSGTDVGEDTVVVAVDEGGGLDGPH